MHFPNLVQTLGISFPLGASRKEADFFLIGLTLKEQPLIDRETGPGLRLASPKRTMSG